MNDVEEKVVEQKKELQEKRKKVKMKKVTRPYVRKIARVIANEVIAVENKIGYIVHIDGQLVNTIYSDLQKALLFINDFAVKKKHEKNQVIASTQITSIMIQS